MYWVRTPPLAPSVCRGMCDNEEDFDNASCTWQIDRLLWRRGFYINMIIMVGPAEFHRAQEIDKYMRRCVNT
jgi:hypothetical protein